MGWWEQEEGGGGWEEGQPCSFPSGLCPSPPSSSLTRTFSCLHANNCFLSQPAASTQELEPAAAGEIPGTATRGPRSPPAPAGYVQSQAGLQADAAQGGHPEPRPLEQQAALLGSTWSVWCMGSETTHETH